MTTPAHTPGPWTVGNRNPHDNTLAIETKYQHIASIGPKPFYRPHEQDANAAIIAAAPAMLQALKEARWALTNNSHDRSCRMTLVMVEQALSLATPSPITR